LQIFVPVFLRIQTLQKAAQKINTLSEREGNAGIVMTPFRQTINNLIQALQHPASATAAASDPSATLSLAQAVHIAKRYYHGNDLNLDHVDMNMLLQQEQFWLTYRQLLQSAEAMAHFGSIYHKEPDRLFGNACYPDDDMDREPPILDMPTLVASNIPLIRCAESTAELKLDAVQAKILQMQRDVLQTQIAVPSPSGYALHSIQEAGTPKQQKPPAATRQSLLFKPKVDSDSPLEAPSDVFKADSCCTCS
jgi:hypothetical protein